MILSNRTRPDWRAPLRPLLGLADWLRLPLAAKAASISDLRGLPKPDPGIEPAIDEAVAWLGRAQDCSATDDGGVARHYSLLKGWGASYPETTGYIVPTMLAYAAWRRDHRARQRARRMLDWLVSIQFSEGGFQGGMIDSKPVVPVTFNTGQILLGLAAGVEAFGEAYRDPMRLAADWLADSQDADGCWRKHPTPFAGPGEKAYETHVAWGLIEAARIEPDRSYGAAALANLRWALGHQRENGWIGQCCLSDPARPLTHTLGYALRGILEAYRFSGDPDLLVAARRTGEGLLSALRPNGFLPGRLSADWRAAVPWACLTGTAQIAHCWLILFEETGERTFLEAGSLANRYVRRTMAVEGRPEIRGAIRGSFPIHGDYGSFEYLNWAAKFFVDSHLLEERMAGLLRDAETMTAGRTGNR